MLKPHYSRQKIIYNKTFKIENYFKTWDSKEKVG